MPKENLLKDVLCMGLPSAVRYRLAIEKSYFLALCGPHFYSPTLMCVYCPSHWQLVLFKITACQLCCSGRILCFFAGMDEGLEGGEGVYQLKL